MENDDKLKASEYVVEEVQKLSQFHRAFKQQVHERLEEYRAQLQLNLKKERLVTNSYEKFYLSQDR